MASSVLNFKGGFNLQACVSFAFAFLHADKIVFDYLYFVIPTGLRFVIVISVSIQVDCVPYW